MEFLNSASLQVLKVVFGIVGWVGPLMQGDENDVIEAWYQSLPLNRVSRARDTVLALQAA